MKIDVTGHHVEITDSLRDYVNEKFQRLERHFDNVVGADGSLTVGKSRRCAGATRAVSGARRFAEADHEEMYAAIDLLVDKRGRQVVKHKGERSDHHRGEGRVGPTLDS